MLHLIGKALKTGLALGAATTAVILLAGEKEKGTPWAGINAIAHIVDGDEIDEPLQWAPRESLLGLLINGTAMAVWGMLYEGVLSVTGQKSSLWTGAGAAAGAYVIDYHVVPPRLAPGIEKRLSPQAVFITYGAMAAAFSLSRLWNKD